MCGCLSGNLDVWCFCSKASNVNSFNGDFDQNRVAVLLVNLMCGRLAVLTKRAAAILVVAALAATGILAILGVSFLEWNRFDQGLYLLSGKTTYHQIP